MAACSSGVYQIHKLCLSRLSRKEILHSLLSTCPIWPLKYRRNLVPGGWLEMQDFCAPLVCDDGTCTKDSTLWKWQEHLLEASVRVGRPLNTPPRYKQWM